MNIKLYFSCPHDCLAHVWYSCNAQIVPEYDHCPFKISGGEKGQRLIIHSVGAKWRQFKYRLKRNNYIPINDEPLEEIVRKISKSVCEDQWKCLVDEKWRGCQHDVSN